MAQIDIPFRKEMAFEYGRAEAVAPGVRRVVCNNPSPFTFHGTNSYVVGEGEVAVIDPGPDDADHVEALTRAVAGETVSHVIVTHTHIDHSPAARAFARAVGARVVGALPAPPADGEPPIEAADRDFAPDIHLADGQAIAGPGWTLTPVFTPGHMSNHHCFALAEGGILFSGDHVMGWNTTIVSPPDGNMGDYLRSLETWHRPRGRALPPRARPADRQARAVRARLSQAPSDARGPDPALPGRRADDGARDGRAHVHASARAHALGRRKVDARPSGAHGRDWPHRLRRPADRRGALRPALSTGRGRRR